MTFSLARRTATALIFATGLTFALAQGLRAGEGGVMDFLTADVAMNEAMEAARVSLPAALGRAAKADLTDQSYRVKWAHPVEWGDSETEHIWVILTGLRGGIVEGNLANQPQGFKGALGDPVSFPASEISDWMRFRPDGVIEGAYTMRVMLDQMSEEERSSYDVDFAALPEAAPGVKLSAGN